MIDTFAQISQLLRQDEVLLAMLAKNKPYFPSDAEEAKVWSVRPVDTGSGELNTPFITIQEGTEVRLGQQLKRQEALIRVYHSVTKTYVDINKVLDRVRELLDNVQLETDDRVFVEIRCNGRLAGLEDQAWNLKFKEENYGILVL